MLKCGTFLRQIEEMRVLPEKISSQLGKKEFLKATAGLTKSLGRVRYLLGILFIQHTCFFLAAGGNKFSLF
jgi:hypothetical protein